MRASTILLIAALMAVAVAIGFFAGRMSVPNPAPVFADRTQTDTSTFPIRELLVPEKTAPADPRADLLRALEQPAAQRNRAVRVAMNAWLAADGAAAIMAARNDPELRDVADRMTQFALFAHPEIFVDNPSLLEGVPNGERLIAMAVSAMAMFDPDAARAMIDTHLAGSMYGDAMLSAVGQIERRSAEPQSSQDPRAELESILAERGMMNRIPRLYQLVSRVAMDDPMAAANLIEDLPASSIRHAIRPLVQVWSRTNPEEAARWLSKQNAQVSAEGLSHLAMRWGQSDFAAANDWADTLTGRKRAAFLTGLVSATGRLSKGELLAWVSRYEDEPAYPNLIMGAAQRFAQDDVGAAIELIETLPEEGRVNSYRSVLSSLAFQDPEAAMPLIDEIGNDSVRGQLVPMVAGMWAHNDAESALDWALDLTSGPSRDQAIASISPSLMEFDMDRAVDAIDEIEDPDVRRGPVRQLLFTVESDDEAIRLGRDYGFDRDAVLELRENRSRMHGPGFWGPVSGTRSISVNNGIYFGGADKE